MKKMALFGGTFDPIHSSHISMALRLADVLGLDAVLLMPTYVPPHKIRESMASAHHRLAMCRLAARSYPILQVSDAEISRGGASFTVDTLTQLREQYPDTQWYVITGADMFCTLRTWHRFADLKHMATFCTVPRAGTDADILRRYADELTADGVACYVDTQPEQPISSTAIRQRIADGQSLDRLVPTVVEEYIRANGLYQPAAMDVRSRDEQFKQIIRTRLSDYRYRHSLCVADEAARLARRYGADAEKAYTAGILHDIMKDADAHTQLQILAEFAILLDEVERISPTLWHARAGEAFIRHILELPDEDILSAVRYHTTGRAGMSLLEKILFVADFTSADRTYDDVDEMRRLSDVSLEAAMEYGIAYTIHDLLSKGRAVHPDTLAAYNEIITTAGGTADER